MNRLYDELLVYIFNYLDLDPIINLDTTYPESFGSGSERIRESILSLNKKKVGLKRVCKRWSYIINNFYNDTVYFPKYIDKDYIKKWKPKNIVAPFDQKLIDKDLENFYKHGVIIKELVIPDNRRITDKGLTWTPFLEYLDIKANKNITDNGLKRIPLIKNLDLGRNENITNTSFQYIPLIQYFRMNNYGNITSKALECIPLIRHLGLLQRCKGRYLYGGGNRVQWIPINPLAHFTNESFQSTPLIKSLTLLSNDNITVECLKYIPLAQKIHTCNHKWKK